MLKKVIKITVSIFIIFAITVLSVSCSKKEKNEFQESASISKYLAFGDSISTGYKLGGGHLTEESFTNIVAKTKGYELDNRAIDGNTAIGIHSQIQGGELDSEIRSAKLITITCGGNDMMNVLYGLITDEYIKTTNEQLESEDLMSIMTDQSDPRFIVLLGCAISVLGSYVESEEFSTALDDFINNLNSIISYIREINKTATVVVLTQYNPYKWIGGIYAQFLGEPMDAGASKLRQAVIDNKSNTGSYVIADVYTAFDKSDTNLCYASESPIELDFHPNTAGHSVIAKCVLDAIK